MLGLWETKVNVKAEEGAFLNLESILRRINTNKNDFVLNDGFKTIRYISKSEYDESVYMYVEPNFYEADGRGDSSFARFIIFSAPGATGKSALAKHICYKKNGIYWDLPDNKVAEFSLQGAIMEAVGAENVSAFLKSIEIGENFLVIDAFDEAEAGSGRTGIEAFLKDLNNITKNSEHICAILMARTESALFIKDYLIKNGIGFKHYEVGLFAEYNAKSYIKNKLRRLKVGTTDIVAECIEQQFAEIKRIFSDEDAKAFIGYAPVLDALATSYDDEKNTLNLLKRTQKGENNCDLMDKILQKLLTREQEKFLKALNVKVDCVRDNDVLDALYTVHEQICRMLGMILIGDSTTFIDVSSKFPVEYKEEYLDVVNTQLPQHPFVKAKERSSIVSYDFTGAAFRDFVLAYVLADKSLADFVDDYLGMHTKYCPSQMLIEFYSLFAKNKIRGKHVPLMYNSFKSFAQLGDKIFVNINGDATDCSAEFNLMRNGKTAHTFEFKLINLEEGIYLNQLSNCYIDVDGDVFIGSSNGEARISNSVINCSNLVWRSENIAIEAYIPGECVLNAGNMKYVTNVMPRFEIKTDERKNLKVSSPNINNYFKLLAYRVSDIFEVNDNGFVPFANLVRRIFSCLRSHSKDTPARKMDFIDNRIINGNKNKKKVLEFLLRSRILYTDEQDWLYKLNTDKLAEFQINWNGIREGNFDSLQLLYDKFLELANK